MCVQDADDRCVLQFTLHNAAGCALHRRASRVIHRSELCFAWSGPRCVFASTRSERQAAPLRSRALARSLLQSCVCTNQFATGAAHASSAILYSVPSEPGSLSDNRPPCDGGERLYQRLAFAFFAARRPTHPRQSVQGPLPFAALQPCAPPLDQSIPPFNSGQAANRARHTAGLTTASVCAPVFSQPSLPLSHRSATAELPPAAARRLTILQ